MKKELDLKENPEILDRINHISSPLLYRPKGDGINDMPRLIGTGFFVNYRDNFYFILTFHNILDSFSYSSKYEFSELLDDFFVYVENNSFVNINFIDIFIPDETHEKNGATIDENDFAILRVSKNIPDKIKIFLERISFFIYSSNQMEQVFLKLVQYQVNVYITGFPINNSDYEPDMEEQNIKFTLQRKTIYGAIPINGIDNNLFELENLIWSNGMQIASRSEELNGFSGSPVYFINTDPTTNQRDFILLGMVLRANGTSIKINHIERMIQDYMHRKTILEVPINDDATLKISVEYK